MRPPAAQPTQGASSRAPQPGPDDPSDAAWAQASYLVDEEGRVLELDDGAERLLGWSADEARGHRSIDLFVEPSRRARMLAVFASLHHHSAAGVHGEALELTLRHRGGAPLHAEVRLERRAGAERVTVLVLLREITRDAAGRERIDWIEGVARASSDAIVSVDAEGVVRAMNPAAGTLYGPGSALALGRPLGEGLSPEQTAQARQVFERVRDGEDLAATRRRYDVPDAGPIWVETTATAAHGADGTFLGATFVSRDVSADVHARSELEEQLERLRSKARPTAGAHAEDDVAVREARPNPAVARVLARALPHLRLDTVWATRLVRDVPMIDAVAGDPDVLGPDAVAGFLPDPSTSLCDAMLRGDIPTVVPDLRRLPEHAHVAAVIPNVAGYVGAPVVLDDGTVYGALGAGSRAPLDVGETDRRSLAMLADVVADAVDEALLQVGALQTHAEQATVDSLVAALDARDQYTADHTSVVVELSDRLAEVLGLPEVARAQIGLVARLHDIGKVGIPDAVLRKPGALTPREWELMREHPAIGERIVASVDSLAHIAAAVRAEHERWDGTGYPDGLGGEAIPVASRVVLVCDAWHAMISDRPYRSGLAPADAVAELRRCTGSQFDPTIAAALVRLLEADGVAGAAPPACA